MKMLPAATATERRFWSKVRISSDANACWPWTRSSDGGYGRFKHDGRLEKAHRFAYFLASGTRPGSLCVCHSCDNPSCCNPSHLWLGTIAENMHDRDAKGRHWAANGASRATLPVAA